MNYERDKPAYIQSSSYVLVVDDEWSIRDFITTILKLEGVEVVAMENGLQALNYLQKHPSPSCILLDYDMPRMNGLQFRKVQQRIPSLQDIPVILMTAALNIEQKAEELQAKAYLKKPFDIDRLVELVSSCFLQEREV